MVVVLHCIVINNSILAQDIGTDSKNKGIYVYYSPKKYRTEFSSKDFSLTIASLQLFKPFVIGADTTVYKRSNYYIQPSIINASDIVSLSELTGFRPGAKLKVGYQTTVDSITDNSNGWTFAIGWNLFASIDNIKLFNTNTSEIEKKYPFTYGVELNYTQFLPAEWMVVSFTGTISNGWNDNSLRNFKELGSDVILNSNIVAFEKFDGKYGVLQANLKKARLSLSTPMSFWYFNPIPYVVLNATEGQKPSYFVGLYTNILSKKLNFRAFKLPSTFGIGIDKVRKAGSWSKSNLFIRGSISLGEL